MASKQAIHELMVQIGPVLDLAYVTEFADDNAWMVAFDTATQIDLEYDEAGARLVLSADLAEVPEPAKSRAHELLLEYNYLWSEHGGVRAAIDAPRSMVVLMLDLRAEELEVSRLCGVLQNLRVIVEGWREALAAIAAREEPANFALPVATMIRV